MTISHQVEFCQHIEEFLPVSLEPVLSVMAFPNLIMTSIAMWHSICVSLFPFQSLIFKILLTFYSASSVLLSSHAWSVLSLRSIMTAHHRAVPIVTIVCSCSKSCFFETLVRRIEMRDAVECPLTLEPARLVALWSLRPSIFIRLLLDVVTITVDPLLLITLSFLPLWWQQFCLSYHLAVISIVCLRFFLDNFLTMIIPLTGSARALQGLNFLL